MAAGRLRCSNGNHRKTLLFVPVDVAPDTGGEPVPKMSIPIFKKGMVT